MVVGGNELYSTCQPCSIQGNSKRPEVKWNELFFSLSVKNRIYYNKKKASQQPGEDEYTFSHCTAVLLWLVGSRWHAHWWGALSFPRGQRPRVVHWMGRLLLEAKQMDFTTRYCGVTTTGWPGDKSDLIINVIKLVYMHLIFHKVYVKCFDMTRIQMILVHHLEGMNKNTILFTNALSTIVAQSKRCLGCFWLCFWYFSFMF